MCGSAGAMVDKVDQSGIPTHSELVGFVSPQAPGHQISTCKVHVHTLSEETTSSYIIPEDHFITSLRDKINY